MKKTLYILILFFTSLAAEETLFLKNRFEKAAAGDFIVALHEQTYSLLHIHSKTDNAVIIEEVSVPKHLIQPSSINWKEWLLSDAKGHSSWIFYELSYPEMKLNDAFSFSSNAWLEKEQQVFETLFSLPFEKVPYRERKKIGPAPTGDSIDHRSVWHPPLIKRGKIIKGALFDAWRCTWPRDGSDLSDKVIEIYLAKDFSIDYYPFWLQLSNAFAKAKIRVIDSGHGLRSAKTFFPRRPPILLNQGVFGEKDFSISFKSPAYYLNYQIWALSEDTQEIISLQAELVYEEADKKSLHVSEQELAKKLKRGSFYRFMIASLDYPSAWTESKKALRLPVSFEDAQQR